MARISDAELDGKLDQKVKDDIVRDILSKPSSAARNAAMIQARRKLKVQPYQLYAWIGKYAIKHWPAGGADGAADSHEAPVSESATAGLESFVAADSLSTTEREVLALYMRKLLSSKPG